MNFVRSRLPVRTIFGQRYRQATESWSHRGMCNKPQPAPPAQAAHDGFRMPGSRPSDLDKKMLIWSGRFKTRDQIPEFVSHEMIDAARTKVRVKACYLMMAATIGACVVMAILGKRAAGRNETLMVINMEKKAKWKEEYNKDVEAAIALPEKAQ
ncbi:FAM162A protein [Solea senegalensis]|uniref:FAM162A protein n=1 Tax=Solea senegalensis TaxID=28829 RepID=A0AAV6T871_SOLSE|nr:protein FAM162B [Solea senegalensis]KAG7525492.1 FAM162A protein [Solea senegalensis]